jgi:hypothetical protein
MVGDVIDVDGVDVDVDGAGGSGSGGLAVDTNLLQYTTKLSLSEDSNSLGLGGALSLSDDSLSVLPPTLATALASGAVKQGDSVMEHLEAAGVVAAKKVVAQGRAEDRAVGVVLDLGKSVEVLNVNVSSLIRTPD